MSFDPVTVEQLTIQPIEDSGSHQFVELDGDTMTGTLNFGTGDSVYPGGVNTSGQWVELKKGSSGSPDTSLNPLLKAERVISFSSSDITNDGAEQLPAISGNCLSVSQRAQPVGVFGGAETLGTADACAIYGRALSAGSATGRAIGGFFVGTVVTASSGISGIEVAVKNSSGSDHSYSSTGGSDSMCVFLRSTGDYKASSGIQFGKPSGSAFDVGIGISSENAVATASFRDDGNASTSLAINGTHSTAAMAVASGSGAIVVGETSLANSSALLEVMGPDSTSDPLVVFGRQAGSTPRALSVLLRTSAHVGSKWWISSGSNGFQTGSAVGDTGLSILEAGKKYLIGGSSSTPVFAVEHTGSGQLGFFSATTAAKQTVTGSRGSNAALASLLTALAAYGLITDSSS